MDAVVAPGAGALAAVEGGGEVVVLFAGWGAVREEARARGLRDGERGDGDFGGLERKPKLERAEAELVAVFELGLEDALALDERAVGRAQVLDFGAEVGDFEFAMVAGDGVVGEEEIVGWGAAEGVGATLELEFEPLLGT